MKVVEINSVDKGSTGKIMLSIAQEVRATGDEAYTFSELRKEKIAPPGHRYFGKRLENAHHRLCSVLTGISGTGSRRGTKELIEQIKQINPDVLHLHNLHGWYINIPMLFDFIKENKIKTIWTLHDCWGFTAQCSHFTIEKCEKWKTGCYSCPRYWIYPYTWVDQTRKMWTLKKQWLTGVEDLTIITPSRWLATLVKQSFLGDYPVKVINNGINTSLFKPRKCDFREQYGLENKKIVLGVASGWNDRKGLDVFVELSKRLHETYQIVLVGVSKKVKEGLPKNIICISHTQKQEELAALYTTADVFVNPTREENYPTVNMESVSCGTPVVTFDTGGSKEMLNEKVGSVVPTGDIDQLESEILRLCHRELNKDDFEAVAMDYDEKRRFEEYVILYKREVKG